MDDLKYILYFLDKKIALEKNSSYSIGRGDDNFIQLPGAIVSRKHANIFWENDHFVIEDTKSTNGVFVNNHKIEKQILYDGDHINIGTFFIIYKEFDLNELHQDDFDNSFLDTLVIEHHIAELLKSIPDKKIQNKILELKHSINKTKTKLDKLANRDRLTKLYNRRYFDEEISKEVERVKRYNYKLSLFMIDIDHFKKFNDTYGHQKGDQVLAGVAQTILRNTRKNDLVVRYGGEEIAVLLPDLIPENAMVAAEKIRSWVEKESPKNLGVNVTISIGVGFFKPDDTIESFIKKADLALYQAKERGRNRVVINTNM